MKTSFSQPLENDVMVAENSDLTYYLDVIYDGKDSNVVTSSDTATADVYSDYIYVEDKIPDGLVFKEFVSTSDGTIGAVKRSDNTSCSGYVVDDKDGLKYDEKTRTISFRIKNLQAGCKLTVGIVTTTPFLNGRERMDFYNYANAREGAFSVNSNTVHVFMGKENTKLYNVMYEYNGDVPSGVSDVPVTTSYSSGTLVGVSPNPVISGYSFSGWTADNIEVNDGSFTMPEHDVTFVGEFTKKKAYDVTYSLEGSFPDDYVLPSSKKYSHKDDVLVDSLQVGDIVKGYRFLGWESSTVKIEDGTFVMPESDVELVGKFERISYKVTYQFQGVDIPSLGDALLPSVEEYYPGDKVKVAKDPVASGYRFLGWYSADTFTMPEEDVVIKGEWMVEKGIFAPVIDIEIVNKKDYYQKDEEVEFKINVKNTVDYEIKDILLEEGLDGSYFVSGDTYEVLNNKYIRIPSIPALGTVTVSAKYLVKNDAEKEYNNVVTLTGAIADDNHNLDTSREYKASVKFIVKNKTSVNDGGNNSNHDNYKNNGIFNIPNTLDKVLMYVALFVVSASILLVIAIVGLKNKKKEETIKDTEII